MMLVDVGRRFGLQLLSVLIAVALWIQVHGQGQGSLSMDVPLQVQGLPEGLVLVNDIPDHVRVTISGLQSRLKELRQEELVLRLPAADITSPGVVERALQAEWVALPSGLHIQKIQPDRLELQVDRLVTRLVPVRVHLDLPAGWVAENVSVEPRNVRLIGPEVWLDALQAVETTAIRPELKGGLFAVKAGIESPSGKAIRLQNAGMQVVVKGLLIRNAPMDNTHDQGVEGGDVK